MNTVPIYGSPKFTQQKSQSLMIIIPIWVCKITGTYFCIMVGVQFLLIVTYLRYQLGCAAGHTPPLALSPSLMFSHLLVSQLCCGNITLHAAT